MTDKDKTPAGERERAEFEKWRSKYFSAGISFEMWPKALEDCWQAARREERNRWLEAFKGMREMITEALSALEER